jgi:hypothetical protein
MGRADNPNYGARGSTRRHHHRTARPTHERSAAAAMISIFEPAMRRACARPGPCGVRGHQQQRCLSWNL